MHIYTAVCIILIQNLASDPTPQKRRDQSIFLNILTGSKQLGEGTIPKARLVNHLKNDAAAAFLNSAPILKSIC